MSVLDHCPASPDWTVDWSGLRAEYDWVDALHQCPQDEIYHAEGDVGTHTEMALESLAASPRFRALDEQARAIVYAAVLLHDVAKPACTKREGDRITSRGHSSRGAIAARRILWRQGIPFAVREAICGLIQHHQVPFFLVDRDDCRRLAYTVSQVARCDHLALVAWADGSGRRCRDDADQRRIVDNVELFEAYCGEHGCLEGPRAFPSDHSRFLYFLKEARDPDYHAHDDTRSEVTLLAGLPGAGKDHWLEHHAGDLAAISLDALRAELGIDPRAGQGRLVDTARARAREFLRARTPFVWNATNVSRPIRSQLIDLFAAYNARVRIVYVEGTAATIAARNRARPDPVPAVVIERLLGRWTVPTRLEAHSVSVELTG